MTTKNGSRLVVVGAVAILASACGSSSSNVATVSVPDGEAAVLEEDLDPELEGEEGSSLLSFGRLRGIFRFSPASGPVGSAVTLTGRALQTAESFVFAGSLFNTNDDVVVTNFTRNSDTEVLVTVPAGAVTGPIQAIDANDRVETSLASFEVTSSGPGGPLTITNPAGTPNADLGTSLTFTSNGFFIGAPGATGDSGVAYLFNSNGSPAGTFDNPDADVDGGDRFANAVAADGNFVLVGASFDDTDGTDAGIAYLFNRTTGDLVATFQDPTPQANGNFGFAVDIAGSTVVIATAGEDDESQDPVLFDSGEVHVFNTSGGLIATLENPLPGNGDAFGFAVDLAGDLLAVGAPGNEFASVDGSGSVYLYNLNPPFPLTTPQLVETINNPGSVAGDSFGGSLDFIGDLLAIGAPGADDSGAAITDSGVVYLYTINSVFCQNSVSCNASLSVTLTSPDPRQSAVFGFAVAISPDQSRVVVGEPLGNRGFGAAYLFNTAFLGSVIDTFANPGGVGDLFGSSVALSNDEALIGAPNSSLDGFQSGRAYLFEY